MTSIAQQVGKVVSTAEVTGRTKEFVQGCMFLLASPRGGAEELARKARASDRVVEFTRSAAAAGSLSGWGSPLSSFQNLSSAFLGSLGAISAFDAMLPSMLVVPLRTTVVSVSATLGSVQGIAEANVKPLSKLSLTASDLDAVKAAALIAMSNELVRAGTPAVMNLVERELRTAIARATNSIFLPIITTGITSVASSGVTATGIRQDLRTLLSIVNSGSDSKLFWIVGRKIAEAWAVLQDVSGAQAFPNATVNGGSIGGVPVLVIDEATDGEIILIDASQVAAGTDGFTLSSSTEAVLDLSTPGDLPPTASTAQTSLWAMNLVALKSERYIGAKLLRTDGAAKITGAAFTGGSPA